MKNERESAEEFILNPPATDTTDWEAEQAANLEAARNAQEDFERRNYGN